MKSNKGNQYNRWANRTTVLMLVTLFLAPQLLYAADKTLSAGENLPLTTNTTWDNLNSLATADNWAVITGPYDIRVTGSTDISYISFQNTGAVLFENETIISHCVFDGNKTITVGTTSSPLSNTIIIETSDFRNQANPTVLSVSSVTGNSNGTYRIQGNTFYYTTPKFCLLNRRNGCLFAGNVIYNMSLGNLSENAYIAGNHTYSENFLSSSSDVTEYRTLVVNHRYPEITFNSNYCYYDFSNPHPFTNAGSGVPGTDHYINNILEVYFNFDGANVFVSNTRRSVDISYNILIGSGSLANAVGPYDWQPRTVNNNTCYSTMAGNSGDGLLFLSENGPSPETIDIYNNIVTGSTNPGHAIDSHAGIQQVAYSDYNAFYNVTTPYDSINVLSGQLHEFTVDPAFIDPTRNLSTWDMYKGGNGTKASVVSSLSMMNGYNELMRTQSDQPSGYTPKDLINWVRYGFTPTNAALQGAGKDGMDIGAVSFTSATNLFLSIEDITVEPQQ